MLFYKSYKVSYLYLSDDTYNLVRCQINEIIILFSVFLLSGLAGSQLLPLVLGSEIFGHIKPFFDGMLYVCLAYIMINVGREFELDKTEHRHVHQRRSWSRHCVHSFGIWYRRTAFSNFSSYHPHQPDPDWILCNNSKDTCSESSK